MCEKFRIQENRLRRKNKTLLKEGSADFHGEGRIKKIWIPEINFEIPRYKDGRQITMWNLIPRKKMPPTRIARYCCEQLKEGGGKGRFVITGVRWAESARRRASRAGLEVNHGSGKQRREVFDPDNPDNAQIVRFCPTKGKHVLNPIIDWSNEDVWEFIHRFKVPYCVLYDQGHTRLGCVGCPMNHKAAQELERYPKFKRAYLKAFEKMLENLDKESSERTTTKWNSPQDVMDWWLSG
ncbi:MAG: phosphoadenosine phosphosulfate reductase family protein [Firmicutes bacterium]|nr:phosphoadenosine phosphosulfate reductase family protein [Bacillota bacterium]